MCKMVWWYVRQCYRYKPAAENLVNCLRCAVSLFTLLAKTGLDLYHHSKNLGAANV